jgi:hypothetical protein
MRMNKKTIVSAAICLFIGTGIAASHAPPEKTEWKNLKIIPKNTDEDQMERIMHKISHDLGVTCSHCHPDTKPGITPIRVDFVTDEMPEKEIARDMMRMTDRLNKKYFGYKNDYGFESLSKSLITCNSCHRGLPKPNNQLVIPE